MASPPRIDIAEATSPEDVAAVKRLFIEYADYLDENLCFQGFDAEMDTFPAIYKQLLLARVDGEAAAAIGLKDLGQGICEMKRLYARPAFQGLGLGRALCRRLLDNARGFGFSAMRLDTLPRLEAAIAIYRELGFVEIDEYYDNPIDGVIYMEAPL